MKIRNKKIRFIAMMPEEKIRSIVKHYSIASLSKGIQDFYNGPCTAVDITDNKHEDAIESLLTSLINYHKDHNGNEEK